MQIAFIGLGNMGSGMAANLARAGHMVHAFDLSADALARAAAHGCSVAASAADAVKGAQAIVTMLPAGHHVQSVLVQSILPYAEPGTLMLDCSTIDVATARSLGKQADDAGLGFVDAPVSGGIAAADAGTLTFMVGGTDSAFAAAQPILAAMGKAIIHAGAAGSGQAAKICNNMLLGASMIATAEAFTLAQSLGLDAQTFFDISSKASGQCWSMTSYCPVPGPVPTAPSNRGYEGGFASALMLKDLKLAVQAAADAGTPIPMGAQAAALYQLINTMGAGGLDFSVVARLLAGDLTA